MTAETLYHMACVTFRVCRKGGKTYRWYGEAHEVESNARADRDAVLESLEESHIKKEPLNAAIYCGTLAELSEFGPVEKFEPFVR